MKWPFNGKAINHTHHKIIVGVGLGLDDLSDLFALEIVVGDDGLYSSDLRVCNLMKISIHDQTKAFLEGEIVMVTTFYNKSCSHALLPPLLSILFAHNHMLLCSNTHTRKATSICKQLVVDIQENVSTLHRWASH